MTAEANERHKIYAGDKVPSMKRRSVSNDYHERRIYMITIAVEGRHPILGRLEGDVNTPKGTAEAPHVVPTPLGEAVTKAWNDIPHYHPEISTIAFQLMPDHIHGILFVERHLEAGLGTAILGFKQGCNKAFRQLLPQLAEKQAGGAASVAVAGGATGAAEIQRHTKQAISATVEYAAVAQQQHKGLLFERGYHDRILLRAGQLDTMRAYIADNPYRLAMKRAHPELLRVHTDINICGRLCSAVGNLDLLRAPRRIQVRISRSMDPTLITQEQQRLLTAAREGAVLVSPAISPGEKTIMRAAFDANLPLIVLLDNGISPMAKPGGQRFEATAEGRLLLLSPFPHHDDRRLISRNECNELNAIAWDIASTHQ